MTPLSALFYIPQSGCFVLFAWYWGPNRGPCICEARALTSLSPSYFFSSAGTITVTEPCILSFQLEMPLMARLIECHITKEKL